MWRKILIVQLLFALALLPAVRAAIPAAAPADTAHEQMAMDCGEIDRGHCIDYDCCASGSHASCDAKARSTRLPALPADPARGQVFAAHPPERYLSHCADLLLRPPRDA